MNALILKPGKEKSLLRRHPWLFSGAVERLKGEPAPGEIVRVLSADGAFLAQAAYSPRSQIRARVWTWSETEAVDETFFLRRLRAAVGEREPLAAFRHPQGALRLVHAESDGLPGLIVDRYADTLVMQVLAAGVEPWRETIARTLLELTGCARVYERSDAEVRELEGLPARSGPLAGGEPGAGIEILEPAPVPLRFRVDVRGGQKTGFFLDQRDNRALVQGLARGRDVLDAFCYSGGFALAAACGGAASVLALDSSAEALALARQNVEANGLPEAAIEWREADVFKGLRDLRDQGRRFDLVVLDPPKFAPTAALAERAARAYKDINLLGFRLLRPGGVLVSFSCSGAIGPELFQKIVAGAALDARVAARVERRLMAAPDHPALLSFPEGEYLKGLVCGVRVDNG
ncbi:MAG TPA: class I SAM-dependent rRNA methyltransferase [Burkholderiales bacterium]|nr:class I SAM-dependent rRNA methyltransferase [Burkholderiales bacterium]